MRISDWSSDVCSSDLVFNFLNLNAGWIHRIDNGHVHRPWRAPTWLMAIGVMLSFVNAALLGAGANVWGPGTLMTGVVFIALIIPVFVFRHYIQDGGKFPSRMLEDLGVTTATLNQRKAGMLPYVTLVAGVVVVIVFN